jgi:RHS repeat-associated protein
MRQVRGSLAGFLTVLVALGSGGAQPVPAGAGWLSVGTVDAQGWFREVVWPGPWQERAAAAASAPAAEPAPGPFDKSRVTHDAAAVALMPPKLVNATGAELSWPAYSGPDLVGYQVHRATDPDFQLSASTLVAAVPVDTRQYTDSTAREDLPDPYSVTPESVYYRVVVRTAGGTLLASPSVQVPLPLPGWMARRMPVDRHDDGPVAAFRTAQEPVLEPVGWELDRVPSPAFYAPDTPQRMRVGERYSVPVIVTNTSNHFWPAGSTSVSYWWQLPDGTDITTGAIQSFTPLPQDLAQGDSVEMEAQVLAPDELWTEGNKAEGHTLLWDVYDASQSTWKSASHSLPQLPQRLRVDDPTSDQLGLEQFYRYAGRSTGGGSTALTNMYAGNAVWSYDAFNTPSLGVGTFVRLAYNSLDTSDSPVGYGWSLQASTVQRVGSWLKFHPPGKDWPEQVRLVDGDGTTHAFLLDTHGLDVKDCAPDTCDYIHPRGVHLYLQQTGSADLQRAWRMTRPDRTVFYFDQEGHQSAAVDRNGNTMTFLYDERQSGNRPTKLLRELIDAGGRRTLSVDYYEQGESYTYVDDSGAKVSDDNLTNPHIIDKVQSITDISGDPAVGGTVPERTLELVYTDQGLLAELTDGAGDPQAKVFQFAYDMQQGNKNVKLVEVTDPRGGDTELDYHLPSEGEDPKLHWRAETITDRLGGVTRFDYTDPDGPTGSSMQAEVIDPEGNSTNYDLDGFGRPTRIGDALGRSTHLTWDADNNLQELAAPNGAVATWTYDPKTGYPITIRDPEANANGTPATVLTYQTERNGFVADLATKASPEGRTWTFGYDAVGNPIAVTDPAGTATPEAGDFTTTYAYDLLGRMTSSTDANGNETSFSNHHALGYPQLITDALDGTVETVYDARGNVNAVTDELDKTTTADYDLFDRPLETVRPVDQDGGEFITTPAPLYDPNDNVTIATGPNGAVTETSYDALDRPVFIALPEGDPDLPFRVSTITYDRVGNVLTQTEPLGNLTTPKDDFVTSYAYDAVYQLASTTDAEGNQTTYTYDEVGNLLEVTDPRGNRTSYTYDLNDRRLQTTDPAGETMRAEYDLDGLAVASIDQQGVRTERIHDARGVVTEVRQPHRDGVTRVARYGYDQVGNLVRQVSPRGTATAEPDDFARETVYDELNRPIERLLPYDPDDPVFDTPDRLRYEYDAAGRVTTVSAPPSAGQSVRNETVIEYLDTGWVESSTDPWGITTTYDYNVLGQQTGRTLHSAGGSADRTMTWDYHLDGSLSARSDDGVPAGLHVVLVDNSDVQNTTTEGDWPTSPAVEEAFGFDYATHPASVGEDSFTWNLHIPQDGTYEVFARWPEVTGAATGAAYTIAYPGGEDTVTVDQSQQGGEWNSLGSFEFAQGGDGSITLTGDADGTVVADAVKLVRDTSGENDTEAKDITYDYDANGNLVEITDDSSGAVVDSYRVAYDQLNRVTQVQELVAGAVEHTTGFRYDPNGNLLARTHDQQDTTFAYDARNLLTGATVIEPSMDPKVTSYTYTARGQRATETKGNGNTVEYEYLLDGGLRRQVENKPDGTLVAEHTYTYDNNGNRASDVSRIMDADNLGDHLERDSQFSYDPRDRIASLTRTDPATGEQVGSESYRHDAHNNVVSRTVDGQTTESVYDRNRLQTTVSGGVAASYNYDPFGRLDAVTGAGQVLERYVYDGFDRIVEEHDRGVVTRKTYDPLDRTRSRTDNAGTADEQTTVFSYLGLSEQVLTEQVGGQVETTYQHSLAGEMFSQVKHEEDGTEEDSFYGYNPHGDVVDITDEQGDTRATYGYTAYGSEDESLFTGVDAPDPTNPDQDPYNVYRFAGKRLDPGSGNYDMGFRDYDPGLNRFLSRDMFNGALADLSLATDPWTMSRYTFAGGNPISLVELDGHMVTVNGGGGGSSQSYDPPEGGGELSVVEAAALGATAGIVPGTVNEEPDSTAPKVVGDVTAADLYAGSFTLGQALGIPDDPIKKCQWYDGLCGKGETGTYCMPLTVARFIGISIGPCIGVEDGEVVAVGVDGRLLAGSTIGGDLAVTAGDAPDSGFSTDIEGYGYGQGEVGVGPWSLGLEDSTGGAGSASVSQSLGYTKRGLHLDPLTLEFEAGYGGRFMWAFGN